MPAIAESGKRRRRFAATAAGTADRRINVGPSERWAAAAAGGGLVLLGLRRKSLPGVGLALAGGALVQRGLTGHCPLYEAFGINTAGYSNPALGVRARHGCKVETSIAVNHPAGELYRFWRQLENLPRIMSHLESVEPIDNVRSRWTAKAPLGVRAHWEAEIINEEEGTVIAWRSIPGSQVDTAGSVHFVPAGGGRGTLVRVSLKYDPPGGKVGAALAGLLGKPVESQIHEDLRRFRQWMEAGEVATTEGQPAGRRRRIGQRLAEGPP